MSRRGAARITAVAAAVLAAAGVLAGAGRAAAQPAVLYAAVTATGSGDCSDAADACTLSTALGDVAAGGVIELVTPGGAAHYVGNWTLSTPGTSAGAPVTVQAAPGLASQPVLDGNNGAGNGCSTASCNGPVLTVPGGEYVALAGITIADANNSSTQQGGGLDNAGTVTITGCTFTGNTAFDGAAIDNGGGGGGGGTVIVTQSTFSGNTASNDGGAIDNGDKGSGSVTVTASTFTGNTAFDGAAIDNGNKGSGSATVTASTFTGNTAFDGAAIDNGNEGSGSATVTASTFSGNTASNDGGAIDNGNDAGRGTVTVTASTFTGNTAFDGGAIDNSEQGNGSVTVTAATFAGNTAGNDGGAIDNGDTGGTGTVQVTASTFTGNTAFDGGAIDNGDGTGGEVGTGTVQVAGDVFDGSCDQLGMRGTWADGGYNAGSDGSCFNAGPGDVNAGSSSNLDLGSLASNGGPTQTIMPGPGPLIGMIPFPTTVTLGGSQVGLCPTTDQRGYPSATPAACDAGAVQTFSSQPALTLKDSATPGSFNQAGQVITYHYKVTNTGAGTLSGITVTDPAVPGVTCPAASLPSGTSQTCAGTYTITAADLAAGKITDTATTAGATTNGVPVTSSTATLTVPEGWPPVVTGTFHPAAGAAEGYYLGVTTNTWQLLVTHPGTSKLTFTGQISVPTGTLGHLAIINPRSGHQVNLTGRAVTFSLPDSGKVTGFSFTTSAKVTSITFALKINGQPATTSQIYLGGTHAQATSGSPLTFTRP